MAQMSLNISNYSSMLHNNSRRVKISFAPWQKPRIMHVITNFFFGQEVGTF